MGVSPTRCLSSGLGQINNNKRFTDYLFVSSTTGGGHTAGTGRIVAFIFFNGRDNDALLRHSTLVCTHHSIRRTWQRWQRRCPLRLQRPLGLGRLRASLALARASPVSSASPPMPPSEQQLRPSVVLLLPLTPHHCRCHRHQHHPHEFVHSTSPPTTTHRIRPTNPST